MFCHKPRLFVEACIVLTSFGLLTGCVFHIASSSSEEKTEVAVAMKRIKEITPEIRDVVKANSDFALDLYARLGRQNQGKNLFFSPYSLSSALTMVPEGARSETAEEMG